VEPTAEIGFIQDSLFHQQYRPGYRYGCGVESFGSGTLARGKLLAFSERSLVGRGQALFEATGLGTAFAVLLNAALSVLRWVKKPGEPLTQTAENFLHAPKKTLQFIGVD